MAKTKEIILGPEARGEIINEVLDYGIAKGLQDKDRLQKIINKQRKKVYVKLKEGVGTNAGNYLQATYQADDGIGHTFFSNRYIAIFEEYVMPLYAEHNGELEFISEKEFKKYMEAKEKGEEYKPKEWKPAKK